MATHLYGASGCFCPQPTSGVPMARCLQTGDQGKRRGPSPGVLRAGDQVGWARGGVWAACHHLFSSLVVMAQAMFH
eukprot:12886149-Prorocentrum_lima.AAC.1